MLVLHFHRKNSHDIVSLDVYRKFKETFKKEDFREKLIPHDMVEYVEPLYDFMLIQCKKHDSNKVRLEKNNLTSREDLKFKERNYFGINWIVFRRQTSN